VPGAIKDSNTALEHYPDYPSAVENKGLVFYAAGQPDSAALYLVRFLTLEPNSPELQKVRAILQQLGRQP